MLAGALTNKLLLRRHTPFSLLAMIGCGRRERPGVYARVSAIDSWIQYLKCDASDFPPEDCTPLAVQITFDDYPEETGYTIVDADHPLQQGMVFVPPESEPFVPGSTVAMLHNVPKGNYRIDVEDVDGFCCRFGRGGIVIRDIGGNKSYDVNANFNGGSLSVDLPDVGTPSVNGVNEANNGGANDSTSEQQDNGRVVYGVQVIILYDLDKSDDISWKIYAVDEDADDDAFRNMLLYQDIPGVTGDRELDTYNRQIELFRDFPAGDYEIHIDDVTGEGMAPGYAKVFELDNDSGAIKKQLWRTNTATLGFGIIGTFTLDPDE